MSASTEELRARDLVRRKEIPARSPVGVWTVRRLAGRAFWRPAGCTARLFAGLNAEDPFAPPPDFTPAPHRTVYAADRFSRIDNAVEKPQSFEPKATAPDWVTRMAALKEANSREKVEDARRVQEARAPKKRPAEEMVHTPAFGGKLASPIGKETSATGRVRAARRQVPKAPTEAASAHAPGEPVDRRPPRVDDPPPPRDPLAWGDGTTPSSPPKAPAGVDRTPPRVGGPPPRRDPLSWGDRGSPAAGHEAPAGLDRRPPRIVPGEAPSRRPRVRPQEAADGVDRRPPVVHHVPTDDRGEALGKVRSPPVQGVDRRPPRVTHDPSAGRTHTVVVGGEPPGGHVPHPKHDEPDKPPVEPVEIDRSPLSRPGPSRRVAVSRPTERARPDEPPPAPPPASAGSLDDLFGGPPSEGRARIGRRKKPEPQVVEEAPAPAPPPPKEPEPPPAPERTPPGPASLDDLFGAAPEGRVRIGRRAKAPAPPEPEPDTPEDEVDRRPPKIDLPKGPKG